MNRVQKVFGTQDEMIYIKSIGLYYLGTREMSRIVLLENYIEAAERRVEWGDINRDEVLQFARNELDEMRSLA